MTPQRTFWSRHLTMINFWLDVLLLIGFLIQAWIIAVLQIVFPRGSGPEWKVWGGTATVWSDSLCGVYCVFAVGVVVHLMLHWSWICGVVSTRLLGRKADKDDGSQTLIGVGIIVLLLHLLMVGILAARMALTGPA